VTDHEPGRCLMKTLSFFRLVVAVGLCLGVGALGSLEGA